jgi:hypothetical protein
MPSPFAISLGIIGLLYLIQIVSPLRLDTDSVWYFREAMEITGGPHLQKDIFPLGYPLIIALVEYLGLPVPAALVFINCGFLFAGCYAIWQMMRASDDRLRMVTVAATLLGFTAVRSALRPLPEAVFFGLSWMALASMASAVAPGARRPLRLLNAILLTILAISVRYAGAALIVPLVACTWTMLTSKLEDRKRLRFAVIAGAAITAVIAVSLAWLFGHGTFAEYSRTAMQLYSGQLGQRIIRRITGTLKVMGELGLNIPAGKLGTGDGRLPIGAGLVFLSLLAWPVRSFRVPKVAKIYLVTYLVMLFVWPFDASRLWMPIMPLVAARIAQSLFRISRFKAPRVLAYAIAVWFLAIGVAANIYSMRISFAGADFPGRYGYRGGMSSVVQGGINLEHDGYVREIFARYAPRQAEWVKTPDSTPPQR